MKAVDTAANRMPIWALTTISFVFVSYIGVLGAVAIFSERDVEFFPPKIGSGPKTKLVNEFRDMRSDIKKIDGLMQSHISNLYKQLNEARLKKSSEDETLKSIDWSININHIESDIEKYEEKIYKEINDLSVLIKETETRLLGL